MALNTLIKSFDAVVTGGRIKVAADRVRTSLFHKKLESRFSDRAMFFTINSRRNDLNGLFEYYGSDKGTVNNSADHLAWPIHSYGEVYDLLFSAGRFSIARVVECGIGTNDPALRSSMGARGKPGASLRAWRDYFPSADIIGCDIDSKILFDEQRIKTYYCDQTNASSINEFRAAARIEADSCDIIIDDGLHEFSAGVCFFTSMIDSLTPNGTYIIEDVRPDDAVRYAYHFEMMNYRVTICDIPRNSLAVGYNTIIIVKKSLDSTR